MAVRSESEHIWAISARCKGETLRGGRLRSIDLDASIMDSRILVALGAFGHQDTAELDLALAI